VDYVNGLKKDNIRTAVAVPRPGEESNIRTIIDAMELLL
jgi:hypothetical protein